MTDLQYSPFSRKISLRNARDSFTERRGFYLRYRENEQMPWRYGEAAPLPGFSKESLEDCRQQLLDPVSRASLLEVITTGKGGEHFVPSLRFALDSIYFSDLESENILQLSYLVSGYPNLEAQRESGIAAIKAGFRVLKIKVSPGILGDLNSLLSGLRAASDEEIRFRLDANMSLSEALVNTLHQSLEKKNLQSIEYIEDPYPKFHASRHGIPFACDQRGENENLDRREFVSVIKPMVRGGLVSLLADLQKENGPRIVLSSSLETELGLVSLRNFARKFAIGNLAHGLATAHVLHEPDLLDRPKINRQETLGKKSLARLNELQWRPI